MDKMKMHSPNMIQENIALIREIFPSCVTEAKDEAGKFQMAVDFDQLKQELSDSIVEGPQERYHLNWPGKREALLTANAPIAKTLRPCPKESVDFETTKNLFIEGDNLDALKLLQETYLGKVKMIYIDPPYNTGNDFVYDDNFSENVDAFLERSLQVDEEKNRLVANPTTNGRFHSDWLSMMYSRLKLARNLLRQDGMIFVSIDDNEQASLRAICDEIFGRENLVECFVWKKSYGGGPKEKYAITQHEYILMYARNMPDLIPFSLPYDPKKIERYYKRQDEHYDLRGPYRLKPLEATKSMDARPNLVYEVELDTGEIVKPQRQWLWAKERVLNALEKNHVIVVRNGAKMTLNYKQYLRDENGVERGEKPFSVIDGIYTQHGTSDLSRHFPEAVVVQFPKPVQLIKQFIEIAISNDPKAIVMDFFAGSATTAEACFALPRGIQEKVRFILVQIPEPTPENSPARRVGFETIADISKERIRRAGKKILEELITENSDEKEKDSLFNSSSVPSVSSVVKKDLDIGFRVLKVDSSNMADVYYTPDAIAQEGLPFNVDNVKEGRTAEDLLFQVLLDWGVDLSLPIRKKVITTENTEHTENKNQNASVVKKSFEVFFVDENALVACFDSGINEELVKKLAKYEPLRVVFRDNGFASDAVKINVEQIFKQMSPGTEVKSI